MRTERYDSPGAVEAAIREAARKAHRLDPSLTVFDHIRQEHFNRFLSRVFSEAEGSDWMLKGGTSILARVPAARSTTDVDLFRRNRSLDEALSDLRRLAAIDLGDFFRFDYTGHTDSVAGDRQTYAEGYKVKFDIYLGANKMNGFHVDLVVGVVVTDDVEVTQPANALDLPKLPSNPYRLYPMVDQIADKVCATLELHYGRPSSREKDLVDLVIIAVTQDVPAGKLKRALNAEARGRGLTLSQTFDIPSTWGAGYRTLAEAVSTCEPYRAIEAAKALVQRFIEPVLNGGADGKTWDHSHLGWL